MVEKDGNFFILWLIFTHTDP